MEARNLAPNRFSTLPTEALTAAQQILALDTQYNPVRPLPSQQYSESQPSPCPCLSARDPSFPAELLYLRRRNQLLQEKARRQENPAAIRLHYLQLRAQLLYSRYGPSERRWAGLHGSRDPSSTYCVLTSRSSSNKSSSRRSSARHSLRQSMESLPVGESSLLASPQQYRTSTPLLGSGLVPTMSAEASR